MPDTPVDDAIYDDDEIDERPCIINPPKQPLFSWRRLVILLVVVGATVVLVKANSGDPDNGGGSGCSNAAVAVWNPCPGSHVLRQSSIGVDFNQGYDGRISINGISIPETEMDGAILPGSLAYEQETPIERQAGPRPNNKNLVAFTPGKGKVVTSFSNQVNVSITYWKLADGEATAQTLTYTVFTE